MPEEIQVSGLENEFKRQVEQGFSSFFANCLVYLMIFQKWSMPKHSSEIRGLCLTGQNTSKFAIFHIYENPKFPFSFHATLFFP